ncbi:hypothetical protein A3J15_03815 [Candidatus Roizmanbacteria bacterium RIFCSPLOWO2_02_FULL_38_10]|uniref:Heat-inducible transcription repressor HrcA n=1 Tax=Candidatus Roizmanbacteria bacterium RIFCSPLOWO2_02_FULL_38_10 TaxID=1802074 RepID=A0A1F7JJL5_9BACT|nr:MAG: hypothetical protein A3J15_03815 [Candidatus Roizmanbacteria bacterium RIFCSPLOWO2_02_FULL_38_10]
MIDLTPRQTDILKKIIQEYTESGDPVGSEILDKKYNLGVCPATVRNEMVDLAKKGYLKKSHFSSGRIPTADAFRFYIKNLMEEKELSTAEEVSTKSDIWDYRNELHRLLQNSTRLLAKRTNMLAVSSTNLGDIYYYGVNNFLRQREFWDLDIACDFLERLDETAFFKDILDEFKRIENEIVFFLGEKDLKDNTLENCATVFGEFEGQTLKGVIGVMGPKRMHYDVVVPNVKYITKLIESIVQEQGL